MLGNVRIVLRSLLKTPGFTVLCVLTLALGIGANTAIFSVIDSVVLRRLPFPASDQLVLLAGTNPKRNLRGSSLSPGGYEYLRDHSHGFAQLAGVAVENLNLTGGDQPEQISAARVTHNFLAMLGVTPAIGRDFLREEDAPGGKPVAIISQGLWNRRFAATPDITGKPMILDGIAYTIIGVMGAGFDQPAPDLDVWVTNLYGTSVFTTEQIQLGAGFAQVLGRLKPGTTFQQAEADLDVVARAYQRENPAKVDADPDVRMQLQPLQEQRSEGIRTTLAVLAVAVGFVLLIACANVAALLLARASARGREIAIRAAVGATRRHVMTHLLLESALLAFVGGMLGLLFADWGTSLLARTAQAGQFHLQEVHQNTRVLLFTLGVSLATGILFGLLPALQVSNPDLVSMLREGGRTASGGIGHGRTRNALVIGQVALSTVLLIGTGLLLRSLAALETVNPGFDAHGVLTMRVTLATSRYPVGEARTNFFDRTLKSIETLPGVQSAAAVLSTPLAGFVMAPVIRANDPRIQFAERPLAYWQSATPGYFETMRIRLIRGRTFNERDRAGAPYVTIVNEAMAGKFWPDQDPIGQHLLIARAELDSEVIGVIADVKNGAMDVDTRPEMYTPFAQRTWPSMSFVIRTAGDPSLAANAVRARMLEVDRDQPVTDIRTFDEIVESNLGPRRLALWLIGCFAGAAVLLALVGLYGVIAYSVAQRRREIGIRTALGANFADICSMVLGDALRLIAAGTLIGAAGSLALTRFLRGLLFQVQPADPLVFMGAVVLFAMVAIAASYVPAHRAARVDPLLALRYE